MYSVSIITTYIYKKINFKYI